MVHLISCIFCYLVQHLIPTNTFPIISVGVGGGGGGGGGGRRLQVST